jgi:hypothetical protein
VELWEKTKENRKLLFKNKFSFAGLRQTWKGLTVLLLSGLILITTWAYAFGFSRIYTRPLSRIAASEWILDNIAGPLNLKINTAQGQDTYPVYIINRWSLEPGDSPEIDLQIKNDGTLSSVTSTDIRQVGVNIYFRISKQENGDEIVTEGRLPVADDSSAENLEITFGQVTLSKDTPYYFRYRVTASSLYSISGVTLQGPEQDSPSLALDWQTHEQSAGIVEGIQQLTITEDIKLSRLKIDQFRQVFQPTRTTLKLSLLKRGDEANPLASAESTLEFSQPAIRLAPTFNTPEVAVKGGEKYQLRYEILEGGPLRLFGEPFALETTWDDSLPLSVRGLTRWEEFITLPTCNSMTLILPKSGRR